MGDDKDSEPVAPSRTISHWSTILSLFGAATFWTLGHHGHQSYFGEDPQQARDRLLEPCPHEQGNPSVPEPSDLAMYHLCETKEEANHDGNQAHGTISAGDHEDHSGSEALVTNGPTMQYQTFFPADLGEWTSSRTWWMSWGGTTTSSTSTTTTWTAASSTTTEMYEPLPPLTGLATDTTILVENVPPPEPTLEEDWRMATFEPPIDYPNTELEHMEAPLV